VIVAATRPLSGALPLGGGGARIAASLCGGRGQSSAAGSRGDGTRGLIPDKVPRRRCAWSSDHEELSGGSVDKGQGTRSAIQRDDHEDRAATTDSRPWNGVRGP